MGSLERHQGQEAVAGEAEADRDGMYFESHCDATRRIVTNILQQMEKFKAVEKDMKTKAYSKEGLLAGAKLDPKEKEKLETCEFLSKMVDELERQIEQLEAETDNLNASVKKGKKDNSKAERVAELETLRDRHKWHQSKLELVLRTLENGGIEVDQVKTIEDEVRYYVENNQEVDFVENEEMYDDLNLQEEEEMFGMGNEVDRVSSQDTQSIAEEPDTDSKSAAAGKQKAGSISEPSSIAARRPSTQPKSPLPALATLHTPLPTSANGAATSSMKPAPPPQRIAGEPLKYASAAAAAAASDKNGIGITPLPPPPGPAIAAPSTGPLPLPTAAAVRAMATSSPSSTHPPPLSESQRTGSLDSKSPALSHSSVAPSQAERSSVPLPSTSEAKAEPSKATIDEGPKDIPDGTSPVDAPQPSTPALTNGDTHSEVEEESIYHLPSSLSDLLESFEATRAAALAPANDPNNSNTQRLFTASAANLPEPVDAERPKHYRPQNPFPYSPQHYPQEPLAIFDDPRLYNRIDTDTLFYLFYYRQGTYQQLLAAKALKSQSWRFHKQYSTWFQRHEEPKSITEEYEQGTYRFFDYESTWSE